MSEHSLELPGGILVLNPTPLDPRTRTATLATIANNPTYQIGFSPIYNEDDGETYKVSGGDATGGWTFTVADKGDERATPHIDEDRDVVYTFNGINSMSYVQDQSFAPASNETGSIAISTKFTGNPNADNSTMKTLWYLSEAGPTRLNSLEGGGTRVTISFIGGTDVIDITTDLFDGNEHQIIMLAPLTGGQPLVLNIDSNKEVVSSSIVGVGTSTWGDIWGGTIDFSVGDFFGTDPENDINEPILGTITGVTFSVGNTVMFFDLDPFTGNVLISNFDDFTNRNVVDPNSLGPVKYPHSDEAITLESGKTLRKAIADGDLSGGGANVPEDKVVYVNASASGANDGTSWENAYTDLAVALLASNSGNQVWVASGTYKPTATTDRTISFQPQSNTKIYGGFAGGENSIYDRQLSNTTTILSGDIGITSDISDNSYNVVNIDTKSDIRFYDLTIRDGNCDVVADLDYGYGGGIHAHSTKNTILTRCKITDNNGYRASAALFVLSANVEFIDCDVSDNQATSFGILYLSTGCSIIASKSRFNNNSAPTSTAIYLNTTSYIILGCEFDNNIGTNSDSIGAGIGIYGDAGKTCLVANSKFTNNSSAFGPAIYTSNTSSINDLWLVNNVYSGNSVKDINHATVDIGGIGGDIRIINDTHYNNTIGYDITVEADAAINIFIYNTICQGNVRSIALEAGLTGTIEIDRCVLSSGLYKSTEPDVQNYLSESTIFEDPAANDFRPVSGSGAIDYGSNTHWGLVANLKQWIDSSKDFIGRDRIVNFTVDAGAFEAYPIAFYDEGIALSDTTSDITADNGDSMQITRGVTLQSITMDVLEAPTGTGIIVDVLVNSVSIGSVEIAEGTKTQTTAFVTTISPNSIITFDVTQVGLTTAGKGLKAYINSTLD